MNVLINIFMEVLLMEKDTTVIYILDEITSETLRDVICATEGLPDGADVELRIASYGGQLLDTISITEILKRFHTHATIIGFGLSAAAILAISCEECSMSENASMLLHSAWSECTDSSDPGIQRCNDLQLQIIKKRCPDFDPELLKKDTWLSAEECLKMHLINSIVTSLSQQEAEIIIKNLQGYNIIDAKTAKLLKVTTNDKVLGLPKEYRDDVRTRIFKNILINLI